MAEVFISYRSIERTLVDTLAEDIEKLGHNVWFDEQLTGGHKWWEQILDEIRRADVVVLALSPAALVSEPCKRERQYAIDLNKNIIPVQIVDGVNFKVLPSAISQLQVVNYVNPDMEAAFELGRAFVNLPPAPALPNPLPKPPPVPLSALAEIKDELEQATISADRQDVILARLQRLLRNDTDREEALILLKQLRRHRDVRVHVAEDIDAILEDSQARPIADIREQAQRSAPQTTGSPARESARAIPHKTSATKTRRSWTWALQPDVTVMIATTIPLYMAFYLVYIHRMFVDAFTRSILGSLIMLVFQGYLLRYIFQRRDVIKNGFSIFDLFYSGPLNFILARQIVGGFRIKHIVIAIVGWGLTYAIAVGISLFTYEPVTSIFGHTVFELYIRGTWVEILPEEIVFQTTVGLIGGYVSGFLMRLAQVDAQHS